MVAVAPSLPENSDTKKSGRRECCVENDSNFFSDMVLTQEFGIVMREKKNSQSTPCKQTNVKVEYFGFCCLCKLQTNE